MGKLVLLKLADNANDAGVCWPLMSTICRDTGAGRTTVQRWLSHFEELGWLARDYREDQSTIYTLTLPGDDTPEGPRSEAPPGPRVGRGGPQSGAGGAPERGTEPKDEPSKEPKEVFSKNSKSFRAPDACGIIFDQLGDEHRKHEVFALRLGEFVKWRFSAGKKMTPEAARRLGLKLAKYDAETCATAADVALEKGWATIYPESAKPRSGGGGAHLSAGPDLMGEGATDAELDDLFGKGGTGE